jgi:hypothetical protein
MNKILLASLLILVAFVVFSPAVLAETVPSNLDSCTMKHALNDATWQARGINCPAQNSQCSLNSTSYTCATCCLVDKIYTFTDWIFVGIMIFVTIKILQGGYYILTSAGDDKKLTAGRQNILWALVGMAIALFARAIPSALVALLR